MKRLLLAFTLTCLIASTSFALPDYVEIEADFKLPDVDESISITRDEWDDYAFALFQATDTNGNQQLEEVEIDFDSETENTFSRADTNQDGRLSIDEFMKVRRTLFKIADINGGGFINPVEYTIFRLLEVAGWKDRNHNNRINFSELRASLANVMTRADFDGDGGLDREEASFLNDQDFQWATAKGPLNAAALYSLFLYHLTGEQ